MARGGRFIHLLIVAVLLIGGLVVVGTLRRSYIAETTMKALEREISRRVGAEVTIGRVGGSILTGVTLEDVEVRTSGGTEVGLARVEARYSPVELVRSPRRLKELRIVGPAVRVARGAGEGGDGTRFPALPVGADRILIEGGTVEDRTFRGSGISLAASLRTEGESWLLSIDALAGEIVLPSGRGFPLRLEGSAVFGPAEACSLAVTCRALGSRIDHAGAYVLGSPIRGRGELVFSPLDIAEVLRSATGREESRTISAEGRLRFAGSADSLSFSCEAAGEAGGIPFERLRAAGVIEGAKVRVERLAAEAAGARIEGEGSLDLENGGESRLSLAFERFDPARFSPGLAGRTASDLNGTLTWKGSGQELKELKGRIAVRLADSRVERVRVREASVAGSVVPGGISVDESVVRTERAEARFGGFAGFDGAIDGRLEAEIPSLAEFRALAGVDTLAGSARASVRVTGKGGRMRAEGAFDVKG
ncbi:MAG: hypothetical protein ABIH26_09465, partial [Candidatus Eisenbacteria bacterium]